LKRNNNVEKIRTWKNLRPLPILIIKAITALSAEGKTEAKQSEDQGKLLGQGVTE